MKSETEKDHVAPELPNFTNPANDRRNGLIFGGSNLLIYFAAPVVYVGVVQAALCDKLGASATVANLPASAYMLGAIMPFVLSWIVPHRLVRTTVVIANLVTASLLAAVGLVLIFPFSNPVRLLAVIGQGLVQGFSASTSQVFKFQCLRRGTTAAGRARAMKWTFTFGPITAVVGSLWAQFVLNDGIPSLSYPYDFACLYLIGAPSMAAVAFLSRLYRLEPVEEERKESFLKYVVSSVKSFVQSKTLTSLWLAYLFWHLTLNAMPNLSLYSRVVLGGDPKHFSGIIMAMRFGFKSVGGFLLGVLAMKKGIRAPLVTTALLLAAAIVWGWSVPGYAFLMAFGLMGAGELGGAYFPNYAVSISSATTGVRNLSLLTLVGPVSSAGPILHGALTDWFGFPASFTFALAAAAVSLCFLARVATRPDRTET